MRIRAVRLLPTAAAVLALTLTSACGGSKADEGETSKRPKASSAPTSEPGASHPADGGQGGEDGRSGTSARTLSKRELDKAALVTADVSGYRVKTPSAEEVSGAGEEKADQAECQPIASVIGGAPRPEPAELVYRQLLSTSKDEDAQGLILFEMLAAYEQPSAERMLAELRKAVKACAGGFTTKSSGDASTYSGVKKLSAPPGADEALAYQVDGDIGGDTVPLLFTVVRSGATVAIFYSMNLMDSAKAGIPQSVVAAQLDKLV